jgi:hypothetical protein
VRVCVVVLAATSAAAGACAPPGPAECAADTCEPGQECLTPVGDDGVRRPVCFDPPTLFVDPAYSCASGASVDSSPRGEPLCLVDADYGTLTIELDDGDVEDAFLLHVHEFTGAGTYATSDDAAYPQRASVDQLTYVEVAVDGLVYSSSGGYYYSEVADIPADEVCAPAACTIEITEDDVVDVAGGVGLLAFEASCPMLNQVTRSSSGDATACDVCTTEAPTFSGRFPACTRFAFLEIGGQPPPGTP